MSTSRNSGNKHQNNRLVSAETVRHANAYIILYFLYNCVLKVATQLYSL